MNDFVTEGNDTGGDKDILNDLLDQGMALNDLRKEVVGSLYGKIGKERLNEREAYCLKKINPELYKDLEAKQFDVKLRIQEKQKVYFDLRKNDPYMLRYEDHEVLVRELDLLGNQLIFDDFDLMIGMPLREMEMPKIALRRSLFGLFDKLEYADGSLLSMLRNNYVQFVAGVVNSIDADYEAINHKIELLISDPQLFLHALNYTLELFIELGVDGIYELLVDKTADFIGKTVDNDGRDLPFEYGCFFGKILPFIVLGPVSKPIGLTKGVNYASFLGNNYDELTSFDFYQTYIRNMVNYYPLGLVNYAEAKADYLEFVGDYQNADITKKIWLNQRMLEIIKHRRKQSLITNQ